jgi:MFS transporter, MHS family, citrate/tricarballylate:H+ symporter
VAVSTGQTIPQIFRENAGIILLGLVVVASGTIGTYVFNYLTTFAQGTLKLSPFVAFTASVCQSIASLVAVLFGGWLSDRIGRRPVMIYPRLIFLVLLLPVYHWVVHARNLQALVIGPSILSILAR